MSVKLDMIKAQKYFSMNEFEEGQEKIDETEGMNAHMDFHSQQLTVLLEEAIQGKLDLNSVIDLLYFLPEQDLSLQLPEHYEFLLHSILNSPEEIQTNALIIIANLLNRPGITASSQIDSIIIKFQNQQYKLTDIMIEVIKNNDLNLYSACACFDIIAALDAIYLNVDLFSEFIDSYVQQLFNYPQILQKHIVLSLCKIIKYHVNDYYCDKYTSLLPPISDDPDVRYQILLTIDFLCEHHHLQYLNFDIIFNLILNDENAKLSFRILCSSTSQDKEICRLLSQPKFAQKIAILLQDSPYKMETCFLIANIANSSIEAARTMLFAIDIINDQYDCFSVPARIEACRALSIIIVHSNSSQFFGNDICSKLIEGLYFNDNDVNILILDALVYMNFRSEEFLSALEELEESSDSVLSTYATKILHALS